MSCVGFDKHLGPTLPSSRLKAPTQRWKVTGPGTIRSFGASTFAALVLSILGAPQSANADLADIGALGPYPYANNEIVAMNEAGQAIGYTTFGGISKKVFIYRDGQFFDIGPGGYGRIFGINEAGDAIFSDGSFYTIQKAFKYTRYGALVDLGTLGGASTPWDINEAGDVVGDSYTAPQYGELHAVLYRNGQVIDVNPQGSAYSGARHINEIGDIAGYARYTEQGPEFAWLLDRHGQRHIITNPAVERGGVVAMNEAGDVIGWSLALAAGSNWDLQQAWLYRGGVRINLTLGGAWSAVSDVNAAGDVVGTAQTQSGATLAFLYARTGVMVPLDLGGGYSLPADLNESGDVVGVAKTAGGLDRAFLYRHGSGIASLGTLGGSYSRVNRVHGRVLNEAGDVVGVSETATGEQHMFLWRNGVMIDISPGLRADSANSPTIKVNESGEVVYCALAKTAPVIIHAFLYRDAQLTDLGGLGGSYSSIIVDITDGGYIGGRATLPGNAVMHAWVTHVSLASDHTPPIIGPVQDVTVEEIDPMGTPVSLSAPTVVDGVDLNPTLVNDAPSVFSLGTTVVTWRASDASGNVSTRQQYVHVVPGPPANQLDNLGELIEDLVTLASIDPQTAGSLDAKVNAALDALARGNPNDAAVAMNQLTSLVNYVLAQSGNHITAEAATAIIARANTIIASLGG